MITEAEATRLLANPWDMEPDRGLLPWGLDAPTTESAVGGNTGPTPPASIDDLGELISAVTDLSLTRAAKLGIPVIGDIGGGTSRRVVVMEWTRFKEITHTDGLDYRFGYAIRFCLTVSKVDANTKLTLPFLSAQAELGNIQAAWQMQVRGLAGQKIDEAVAPPKQLSVETFVIAQQSLEKIIAAIRDPSTRLLAGTLLARSDPLSAETRLRRAVLDSYAVSAIARGRTFAQAQADAPVQPGETELLRAVYEQLDASLVDRPSRPAMQAATAILGGFRTDG
jgi:hypothetical protein